MAEKAVVGERPFIGPLTRGQAITVFGKPVREELKQFVPEKCRDCWNHLENGVIYRLSIEVALGEKALIAAAREVAQYTSDCTGSKPNEGWADAPEICPKDEEEKRQGTTICW